MDIVRYYVMNDRPAVACVISKVELQGHPYVTLKIVLQALSLYLNGKNVRSSVCASGHMVGYC